MRSLSRIILPLVAGAVLVEASGAAPRSPQLIARVGTRGAKPCGSAVYGKSLYVANYGSGTLARTCAVMAFSGPPKAPSPVNLPAAISSDS